MCVNSFYRSIFFFYVHLSHRDIQEQRFVSLNSRFQLTFINALSFLGCLKWVSFLKCVQKFEPLVIQFLIPTIFSVTGFFLSAI